MCRTKCVAEKSTKRISDIVGAYAQQSYDGVEIDEDAFWDTDDIIKLQDVLAEIVWERNHEAH